MLLMEQIQCPAEKVVIQGVFILVQLQPHLMCMWAGMVVMHPEAPLVAVAVACRI
jgi:hypothetical protein